MSQKTEAEERLIEVALAKRIGMQIGELCDAVDAVRAERRQLTPEERAAKFIEAMRVAWCETSAEDFEDVASDACAEYFTDEASR